MNDLDPERLGYKTCDAQAMSFGFFEDIADPVPPCPNEGTRDVVGFLLCRPCEDALKAFIDVSTTAAPRIREENGL